jgi:hypothetical protein
MVAETMAFSMLLLPNLLLFHRCEMWKTANGNTTSY